jgi:LGFP repeat-containing protein
MDQVTATPSDWFAKRDRSDDWQVQHFEHGKIYWHPRTGRIEEKPF